MKGRFEDRVVRDVDEEIRYHLERTITALEAEGLSAALARAEAHRRFGSVDRHRLEIAHHALIHQRRKRRKADMQTLRDMVHQVWRELRRAPGFASVVVAILALGIGANGVTFGLLDRLLLQPPAHIEQPLTLKRVWIERAAGGNTFTSRTLPFADLADFKTMAGIEGVAISGVSRFTLGHGPEATRATAIMANGAYFRLLGPRAHLGRLFGEDDDRIDAPLVAVISHAFWRRHFAGRGDAVGEALMLDGRPAIVVGVAPPGFTGADLNRVDLWLPLEPAAAATMSGDWHANRRYFWLHGLIRLSADTAIEQAEAEATTRHRVARADQPHYDPKARVLLGSILPGEGPGSLGEARVAAVLAVVAALVLLIAAANVAHLLLARTIQRRHELAIRLALGISRRRLIGERVLEAVALASIGGCVSLALVRWGGDAVRSLLLPQLAWAGGPTDRRTLVFIAGISVLAGVISAVIPAIQSTRASLRGGLSAQSPRTVLSRRGLVTLQAALSTVLLIGAGLFVRSLEAVSAIDLGFDPERVIIGSLELVDGVDDAAQARLAQRAVTVLRNLPGVEEASASMLYPFLMSQAQRLRLPGREERPRLDSGGPYIHPVDDRYFAAMGLEIQRGRGFTPRDRQASARVAVVNQTMADLFWPDEDPIGQCLLIGADDPPCAEVVGVIENAHRQEVIEDRQLLYFVPLAQNIVAPNGEPPVVIVRTRGNGDRLAPLIRRQLFDLGAEVRFAGATPLAEIIAPQMRAWRLGANLFGSFGLIALAVAAVGLYSALSFEVASRKRELGIRAALGATARDLLTMVVENGLRLAAVGIALGLLLAWMGRSLVSDLLYGVSATDATTYVGVVLVLATTGLVASWLPGRRASRADPISTLRAE